MHTQEPEGFKCVDGNQCTTGVATCQQGQCTVEFAKRLGEVIQLDDASADVIRTEFTRVAERISEQVRQLAMQHQLRGAAEHRLDEVVALSAALRAEAEGARVRAETAIGQLFETNRILGETQARLVADGRSGRVA
jgi:hypothetical protein